MAIEAWAERETGVVAGLKRLCPQRVRTLWKRSGVVRSPSMPRARACYAAVLEAVPGSGHDCCVCVGEMAQEEVCVRLPCGHQFHYDCMQEWLLSATKATCPLCRAKIKRVKTKTTRVGQSCGVSRRWSKIEIDQEIDQEMVEALASELHSERCTHNASEEALPSEVEVRAATCLLTELYALSCADSAVPEA